MSSKRIKGEHLTPESIFKKFIKPSITDKLKEYVWVDLFAGEGNLILPLLKEIDDENRVKFFQNRIFLFDIQKNMVEDAIDKAVGYGIPKSIAKENINQKDTIENYPKFIKNKEAPVYHITNPPYVYKGYMPKQEETKKYLRYFEGDNEGYQDLYQLAMMNDLRNNIRKAVYIIPANFLFGNTVSNKIRNDFLKYYTINKAKIFEKPVFKHTGENVVICFFERKDEPSRDNITFKGVKRGKSDKKEKKYTLKPDNSYRVGAVFKEFTKRCKHSKPLNASYYLKSDEVQNNKGDNEINVIDSSEYKSDSYKKTSLFVNDYLYKKIKSNILFVRTLDTGTKDGRAGLYEISKKFNVDGIFVSGKTHRTHPIQIFLSPSLSVEKQRLLKNYFNTVLEYFRELTDSEFLTTYKYSGAEYTRKYLGLRQTRRLIKTFPINLKSKDEDNFRRLVENKEGYRIVKFLEEGKY